MTTTPRSEGAQGGPEEATRPENELPPTGAQEGSGEETPEPAREAAAESDFIVLVENKDLGGAASDG